MKVLKIGIVEDELIIAGNIERTLAEIGYQTTEVAISYNEAVAMLQDEQPDLVLLDINLSGRKDGIDVAAYINENEKIPFIFLTANSDITTLERAKKVAPHAYLIKPFTKEELFVSIEVAVNNFNTHQQPVVANRVQADKPKEYLFLRSKQSFIKVLFNDILFVESNDNYITIHLTTNEKLVHRSSLAEFAELLPPQGFYRCHRSFIVSIAAIQKIEGYELTLHNHPIPIGKDRLKELLELLGIAG